MKGENLFSPLSSSAILFCLSLGLFLDFGFFFESFPSLAIWPTYCILLSTFSSVLSNLSVSHLSISSRKLRKNLVEMRGLEPLAYALQRHRSPS